ncbi:MAG: TolC family protein [Betaproteobacteria bacterium]|nr:TolC family protein [Betaproteobacteria bacterium]
MKLNNHLLFHTFLLGALAALTSAAWGQVAPATGALPGLMAEALARHPQVRMQQALASAAGVDVDSARWQYFPTPSLSVERANATNDPALVNRDDPVSTLRISQPIWTGGKLGANVTRANELKQSKEASVLEARQQLALRVLQAYTDWQLAHLRGKAFEDSLQGQSKLLEQVQRRLSAGAATEADVLLSKSRIESTQADLYGIESQKAAALARLSELLARRIQSTELSAALSPPLPVEGDDSLWMGKVQSNSPSVQRLQAQALATEAEVSAARADMYPQLSLRFERQHGSFTYLNYGTVDRVYLSVSSQVGAGLSTFTQQQSAQLRLTAAQTEVENERQNLNEQVRNDLTLYRNLSVRIPSLNNALQSTRLIQEAWERQFLAGRKSWLEVMNAVREIQQAESQLIEAQTNQMQLSWRLTILADGGPRLPALSR